jgi:GWxTD domain-containing protein
MAVMSDLRNFGIASRELRGVALLLISTLFLSVPVSPAAAQKQKLEKSYKEWLERDVAYFITKDERETFLKLAADEMRDRFIANFWELRNPSPGSPENRFKDEVYQRIAYANAHYSIGSGEDGWRTDRGRTYITLGPPQQIEKHYGAPNLLPMEIWFYSDPNPALPSFFYILFYQRDNVGDFRFYSPSMDGPDKLVTGTEAINDSQAALHIIQSSVGPEVARIAQTLIPGEPLDPNGRIGLQSDLVLARLKNLANQPVNLKELDRRRQLVATVTSRLVVEARNLDIVRLPVRDSQGITRLDYAVRLRNPGDLTVKRDDQGNDSYAVEVRVQVLTPDGKLIFTQQKSVSGNLGPHPPDEGQHRVFGYEGLLPLPPGKYHLDFLVTDQAKRVGFHGERDVDIPGYAENTFVIPAILPFSSAEPVDRSKDGLIPFAMAGLRFMPFGTTSLFFNQSQNLNVAYQIWAPPKDPHANVGEQLEVEYALGDPAVVKHVTVIKDAVDMGSFTPSGVLVNGKKIPLADEPEGNYLFTVSVSHPGSPQKAHSELSFQILGDVPSISPLDVDEPAIEADEARGILDQQRALCYLSQGLTNEARSWFRRALQMDHGNEIARAHLVDAYYTLKAYPAVVSLLDDAGITPETDLDTLVKIAESLLKTGNNPKALSFLQDAIRTHPQDGPLYMALADCYHQMGNAQKEQEMLGKGQALLKAGPSAPSTSR